MTNVLLLLAQILLKHKALEEQLVRRMKLMAKCSLGAALAMALVCNANAKAEKPRDKNNSGIVDAEPRKDKDGIVYSLPDGGSSLALLAISVALVAVGTRVAKLSNC